MNSKPSTKTLVLSAACVASSIIATKLLSFTIGPFRIGLENLPIIMAGVLFGPSAGAIAGATSDLLGCALNSYVVNPVITLGAATVGAMSGIAHSRHDRLAWAIALSHLTGSILIKSLGLFLYGYPLSLLLWRLPIYAIEGVVEYFAIRAILPGASKAVRQ